MKKARLQPVPPTEYDGTTATYDDFLTEYAPLAEGIIACREGAIGSRLSAAAHELAAVSPAVLAWSLLFAVPLIYFFVISFWSVGRASCARTSRRRTTSRPSTDYGDVLVQTLFDRTRHRACSPR